MKPSARRELRRCPLDIQARILPLIDGLSTSPRPSESRKIQGAAGLYRCRVGSYRVIYTVDDAEAVVRVTRIGHRRDVYRRL
jgi:mRNA interferase RelE/StbE